MNTYRFIVAAGLLFAAAARLFSQVAVAKPSAADVDFAGLQIAARPLAISAPTAGVKKTKDDFDRDRKMQSAAFLAAATLAQNFYTKYPAYAKTAEAKKIEVVCTLRAVQTGSVENEPKGLRMAQDYRSDKTNASIDRYQIATLVTQMDLAKKHITERTALMAEYEKRAYDLYGEFPDEPAVYDAFLGIAKNADPVQARSVASHILTMPAPDAVKEQAQAVIDRQDMPGKTISLEWQDDSGKLHKIDEYRGKPVVFYVWASWSPASSVSNGKIASLIKGAAELVSVNVDTLPDVGKTAKAKAPFTALSYLDDRGLNGPLPKQLRADKVPSVYVVDGAGVFVGSGMVDDLPSLLQKAGK